jgi:hypothetical protein
MESRSLTPAVAGATGGVLADRATGASVRSVVTARMTQLHDLRLRLLVQQESERIADSQPDELDLSVVQARCLCWLALLAEAHEEQATDAERRGDVEQAMGWFADSMRLRDVIQVVSSIEIPLPAASDPEADTDVDMDLDGGSLAA